MSVDTCDRCAAPHPSGRSCIIPDAPWYVTSVDRFMSGWGPCHGRINLCVVPCESRSQALDVLAYVKTRSDQTRARVVYRKPRALGRLLSVVPGWREMAEEMKGDAK